MKKLGIIVLIIIVSIIFLSFKNTKNYYKYTDNSYFAVIVDGIESSSIPSKGNYSVKSICSEGKAKWDYDEWKLQITDLTSTVKCVLTFTTVIPVNLATHIMDLANDSGSGVYAEEMSGGVVDYRYEGDNPNNYIYFNNELWRIIGVFSDNTHGKTGQKLVKIIRNDSIGAIAWDKNNANNWPSSSLYTLLNTNYYNGEDETTLTNCYQYSTTIAGNCNFKQTGITNTMYRNMIENVTWHLGGIASMTNAIDVYTAERGTTVYSGRPTETTGYIGLMYLSDYGYSVESSPCPRTTSLGSYNTANCSGQAWLRGNGYEWTIFPFSSHSGTVWSVNSSGNAPSSNARNGCATRPSLYLKSNVQKLSGTGSVLDPYIIVD